jgi:alpha-D-ribose 1-methylphosphonate 5-triphosphate synthase subunit PhnI
MAKRIIEFDLENDKGTVLVEVNEYDVGGTRVGRVESAINKTHETLEKTLGRIKPIAEAMLTQFQNISQQPDTMAVEFGVKFGLKGDVIIASSNVDTNYKITLSWSKVNLNIHTPTGIDIKQHN